MTWRWGTTSRNRLERVNPLLVETLDMARSKGCPELTIPRFGGARTLAEQAELVDEGDSWTLNSLHRINEPGHMVGRDRADAVDVAPYPTDWEDERAFEAVAAYILAAAMKLDIRLRWGGLWHQRDLGHFALME